MKIAARLAVAATAALLLLPGAALATANPAPQAAQAQPFAPPQQAGVLGAAAADAPDPRLLLKKRKKPQLQTRFFAE